ncbi:MAG: twin-arginine translocase subunit TatC [Candidatus Thermoplasmatota archaeon]|nr:twin-arginine translocase subunit TatC [Candidatus Thermoplasmatota archaeon]|tara:strand:+ start:220 stop:984 length:765 start_codon:yes stop_codon:yes gene_type:complete
MAEGAADVLPRAAIRGLIEHISRRLYLLLAVFVAGMVGGYPLAGDAIEWLMQADGYLPEGVQVIILQPMEVVLLRLRIAANIGIALVVLTMLCDIGWNGRKILSDAYRRKFVPTGGGFGGLLFALTCSLGLGACGALYSHEILVPMLLEYLSEDAASAGLDSTWQLQSWIGFILGLYFASVVGFQVPLAALLLLRYDVIERTSITDNRGGLWFSALLVGAVLSPPDPLSLFLVGGPMLVLLEVALIIDRMTNRD